jgi:hypothetical protein
VVADSSANNNIVDQTMADDDAVIDDNWDEEDELIDDDIFESSINEFPVVPTHQPVPPTARTPNAATTTSLVAISALKRTRQNGTPNLEKRVRFNNAIDIFLLELDNVEEDITTIPDEEEIVFERVDATDRSSIANSEVVPESSNATAPIFAIVPHVEKKIV